MTEIHLDSSQSQFDVSAATSADNADASATDAQAFLEALEEEKEELLQAQYEKNFQTISYLFMKNVYSNVEDDVRAQW